MWFAVAAFQQYYPLYQTRSYEIGTLALPGSGEINCSLKMPVNGGFTVSLANAGEDGRAVVFRDGVRADGEACRLRVPEPEGGFKRFLKNSEDPEVRTQRARFHRALVSCRSFEYYGVVRFMLFDDRTGELLGVKYNPSGQQGASVARFGNIASCQVTKALPLPNSGMLGRELRLEWRSKLLNPIICVMRDQLS